MTAEQQKMQDFLGKLWKNPAVEQTPLPRKENQIISFLKENQGPLQKVFASEEYFPHLSWDETMRLFLEELIAKVLDSISPTLDKVHGDEMLEEITSHFKSVPIDRPRLKTYLLAAMRNKQMRDYFFPVITVISTGYYNRYVPLALANRKTIHIETVRRDRIDFDAEVMTSYLNLCTLFRPLFYQKIPGDGRPKSVNDSRGSYSAFEESAKRTYNAICDEAGPIPFQVVKTGLESNLSSIDFAETSGAARIISIFCERAKEAGGNQQADRGAESPDKSWFSIARRGAKHMGLDVRILEELYMLAGDQGW